jgi:hypothetical protein
MHYLGGNEIEDVSAIKHANWKELEELTLDCNNITTMESLINMPFKHLTHLYVIIE